MNKQINERLHPFGTKPDFIVVGGLSWWDNDVMLLASRTLSKVKIAEKLKYLQDTYGGLWNGGLWDLNLMDAYVIEFSGKMDEYVLIKDNDYPSAWQSLFEFWARQDNNDFQDKELPSAKALGSVLDPNTGRDSLPGNSSNQE